MAARIHLDTDLGGDPDDLCALALLLGWPEVVLTGVTTCTTGSALRAGMVEYALRLAGRAEIPVAAGAEGSLGGYRIPPNFPDLERHWPGGVTRREGSPGAALDLLAESVRAGATVVATGPCTNLALLEAMRPGILGDLELVMMGGCVHPVPPGLPAWGAEEDYNLYQDPVAARVVFERGNPLIVPLEVTLQVPLKGRQLPRLRAAGALGELIALQGELEAAGGMSALGRAHADLPDDLLNFQHDPLACAVAAGWDGVEVEEVPLVLSADVGVVRLSIHSRGKPTRVVTRVDRTAFDEAWLRAVERAGGRDADRLP
jgi:purine nucleosidase